MNYMIRELYALEQLSNGKSCVHKLHPTAKLLVTICFLVTVASFDRYSIGRLIPYIFYPTLLMALSETPYAMLLKRFLIALPICLFTGVANIIFDRTPVFEIGAVAISCGTISLFTLLFKTYLCVMAVLLLVSVTPLAEITDAMRRLKIPGIFVAMFEMTYRYVGVLFSEAYSMHTAYTLRSAGVKGIAIKDMGSFVGQLLLRSIDRADRVYNAMMCRGYALRTMRQGGRKVEWQDILFCVIVCMLLITLRVININALFTGLVGFMPTGGPV
jgi:cobalt/nickel transport system permease protein